MPNEVGDCFKFLWPFQNVRTLLEGDALKKKNEKIQITHEEKSKLEQIFQQKPGIQKSFNRLICFQTFDKYSWTMCLARGNRKSFEILY